MRKVRTQWVKNWAAQRGRTNVVDGISCGVPTKMIPLGRHWAQARRRSFFAQGMMRSRQG
jgi:hypothetical protein